VEATLEVCRVAAVDVIAGDVAAGMCLLEMWQQWMVNRMCSLEVWQHWM